MSVDILCEVDFSDQESTSVRHAAEKLGTTPEEVIRKAVKFFVAQCVPTQAAKKVAV